MATIKHISDDQIIKWIDHIKRYPDDETVKEKLILHYESLVQSLARKYVQHKSNQEDLTQVGMIGVMLAVERFDMSINKSFEAFLIPTVVGEMKRYIRDKTWSVHVPRRVKELDPKIHKAVDELTVKFQRTPTLNEIAAHLTVSVAEILETIEMSKSYKALSVEYEMKRHGGVTTILDIIGMRERNYERIDHQVLIESVLPILSKRERCILKCIYFDRLSQQETGEILGISQMHVSRLQRQALHKLRVKLEGEPNNQ